MPGKLIEAVPVALGLVVSRATPGLLLVGVRVVVAAGAG